MEMIKTIIETFLPSALLMAAMLFFLVVSIFAKVGSGVYKTVFNTDYRKFDPMYFLFGLLKGVIFGLSAFAVSLVVSGVPIVLAKAGILGAGAADVFSNIVVLGILATACALNLKDTYNNYKDTLKVTDEQIAEMNIVGETKDGSYIVEVPEAVMPDVVPEAPVEVSPVANTEEIQ